MQQRKAVIIKILLVTMVLMFCFGFVTKIVTASSSNKDSSKVITSIQVEKDDTLWDIAEVYYSNEYTDIHEYIDEIKHCNGLVSDKIYIGQHLIIPYFNK